MRGEDGGCGGRESGDVGGDGEGEGEGRDEGGEEEEGWEKHVGLRKVERERGVWKEGECALGKL